jgi:hypothetical protein
MPEKKPKLTALEARKQILLLESKLNREQLVESIAEWKEEFHHSKQQLARIGSWASLATKAFATFTTAKRLFSRSKAGGKKSWFSFLLDGLSTGTSLWFMLRSHGRKADAEE